MIFVLIILVANTARCTLTLLQIYSWKQIPVGCVTKVQQNTTYETYVASPFEHDCLNYAELALMTATSLAALVAVIVLASNLVLYQRLNNYREMHNSTRTHARNSSDLSREVPVNT